MDGEKLRIGEHVVLRHEPRIVGDLDASAQVEHGRIDSVVGTKRTLKMSSEVTSGHRKVIVFIAKRHVGKGEEHLSSLPRQLVQHAR